MATKQQLKSFSRESRILAKHAKLFFKKVHEKHTLILKALKKKEIDDPLMNDLRATNSEILKSHTWVNDDEKNLLAFVRFMTHEIGENYRNLLPEAQRHVNKGKLDIRYSPIEQKPEEVQELIQSSRKVSKNGLIPQIMVQTGLDLNELTDATKKYVTRHIETQKTTITINLLSLEKTDLESLLVLLSQLTNKLVSEIKDFVKGYEAEHEELPIKLGNPIRDAMIRSSYFHFKKIFETLGAYKLAYTILDKELYQFPDIHYGGTLDPWNAYRDFFMNREVCNAGSIQLFEDGRMIVEVHSHVGGNGISFYGGNGNQKSKGSREINSVQEGQAFFNQKTSEEHFTTDIESFAIRKSTYGKNYGAFISALRKEYGKVSTIRSANEDSTLNMMMSAGNSDELINVTRKRLSKLVTLAWATRKKLPNGKMQNLEERYKEMAKDNFEPYLGMMAEQNLGVLLSNLSILEDEGKQGMITLPSVSPMSHLPSFGIAPLKKGEYIALSFRYPSHISEVKEKTNSILNKAFGGQIENLKGFTREKLYDMIYKT